MADWILGYQKGVQNAATGVSGAEWQRFEMEVTEHPPADLKSLYSAFNGGELNGGVQLYRFDQVLQARESSEDSTWVFGEKGNQRLIASRKATLAAHPGLMLRPTWFETTHADDLVFAVHDAHAGTVRVYPSLEQLLAVLVPPAQLEVFGDQTYARAMKAVESAISDVAGKVKTPSRSPRAKSRGKEARLSEVESPPGAAKRKAKQKQKATKPAPKPNKQLKKKAAPAKKLKKAAPKKKTRK